MTDLTSHPVSERERWEADIRLREREVKVKEDELGLKAAEQKRSRWSNPLFLAVLAAAFAIVGNTLVALLNGWSLEQTEETKAEAARILEVIKTPDQDQAAENLKFLIEAGLILNDTRRENINTFLRQRSPGQGPSISSYSSHDEQNLKLEGEWHLSFLLRDANGAGSLQIWRLHVQGKTELKGEIEALDTGSKGLVHGFNRAGSVILSYGSADPNRAGFGSFIFRPVPIRDVPDNLVYAGTAVINVCSQQTGTSCDFTVFSCPALLTKARMPNDRLQAEFFQRPCEIIKI